MTTTDRRKASLINLLYLGTIVVLFFLFVKYAFWLFSPFIFAGFTAIILQKPVNTLYRKCRIRKSITSVVILVLLIAVVVAAAFGIGYSAYSEIRKFTQFVIDKFNNIPELILQIENWVLSGIHFLPDRLEPSATESVKGAAKTLYDYSVSEAGISGALSDYGVFAKLRDFSSDSALNVSNLTSPVFSIVKAIPQALVSVLIYFIASFFLTTDYDNVVNRLKTMLKKQTTKKLSAAKRVTLTSLGRMFKSYVTIILVTFTEVSIGLFILKFAGVYDTETGYIFILAGCTALLDILPVFGTGTVFIPWALYCLTFGDHTGMGIGLLIIYVCITVIRQVLEPKLVGANLDIHPIVTLMGMYVGLETLGFVGMFLIPIVCVVLKMLNHDGIIHLWGEERKLATVDDLPPAQPPIFKQIISSVASERSNAPENSDTEESTQSAVKEDTAEASGEQANGQAPKT